MVNYKKRMSPIPLLDILLLESLFQQASQIRAQHPPGHPYRQARDHLITHLRYLTEDLHYTPAQIAEESPLSYRSIKRYLNP